MELTVLNRLQVNSNVEIQRLLRRDQRSTEIERQATKAWADCVQRGVVAAMMYSRNDYRFPSTAARLKRMREEVIGKRSWSTMVGWDEDTEEQEAAMTGDDLSIHIDELTENVPTPSSPVPPSYPLSSSALVLRQPWRVDTSEGPARVRRRLCDLHPMRADVPLFSHPYKLWEEERRTSITGEDPNKGLESEESESQMRVEDEEDADTSTVDLDVGIDMREEEQVELGMKEDKIGDESMVESTEEGTERAEGQSEGDSAASAFTHHASVSISMDGELMTTELPIDAESRMSTVEVISTSVASSPRLSTRPGLTVDTTISPHRRHRQLSIIGQATGEDIVPPLSASNVYARLESSPLSSASPRSNSSAGGPRSSRARGASFTATTSSLIPAVSAEPKRRKAKKGGGGGQSPHSPTSSSPREVNSAREEGGEDTISTRAASQSVHSDLPAPSPLHPIMSAPVLSHTLPGGLSTTISVEPAGVGEGSEQSQSRDEESRSSSPDADSMNASRRAVTRPRSFTAEDAAPSALTSVPPPPSSISTSNSSTSLSSATVPSTPNILQPPTVPIPGSNDDDEGAEADELFFLEEEKIKLILAGDDIHYHWNCVRVDGMEEVRGILCLCEFSIFLIDNYEISQEGDIVRLTVQNDGELTAPSPPPVSSDSTEYCKWPYSDVIEIAKRRYLLRPAALELFFTDGTNHLLVVNVEQREAVFNHLVDKSPAVRSSRFLKAGHLFTGDVQLSAMQAAIAPLTKQWQLGEISNFEYLMALNSVAGRTYNDLTQYPVFPWIVKDYDSPFLRLHDPSTYRDLTRPMGALTEPRAAIFRQRYKEIMDMGVEEEGAEAFHYSSHYSTAAVVLYYLLRCEPFTQHLIAFQSGRFDRPDRLFHSIKQSYLSASQQNVMDVKELIPEFFASSDFLVNGNQLKLGVRQDELRVNDVLLPRWAQGSARQFIRLHRAALESEYVSAHLHQWVDLIFGFQQQGKEAVQAQNVFHYLTYAGRVDIDQIDDPMRRAATIETQRSFGQTPTQLFTSPHPAKKAVPRLGTLFRSTLLHRFKAVKSDIVSHAVGSLYVAEGDNNKVYATRPGFLIVPTAASPTVSAHFGVHRLLSHRKAKLPPNKAKSTVAFVAWGFPDRSVRTGLVGPNVGPSGFSKVEAVQFTKVYLNMHEMGGVGVVAVPEVDVGLLVTAGAEDCVVSIWKAEPSSTGLFGHYQHLGSLYGHSQPVTCLAVSRAYSLIASGSSDSTVILWDLNRKEAVRQVRVVPYGAVITELSFDQSSGALAIVSRSPDTLSVVDVNGVLLSQYPDVRRMEATLSEEGGRTASNSVDKKTSSPPPTSTAASTPPLASIPSSAPSVGVVSPAVSPSSHPSLPGHHSSAVSSLSMADPISCLHVVDAAGFNFLNSLLMLITGHRSGKVKLWYITFDTLHSPASSHNPSASSTLRFNASATTSSLPPPPFSDTATSLPFLEASAGLTSEGGKAEEEKVQESNVVPLSDGNGQAPPLVSVPEGVETPSKPTTDAALSLPSNSAVSQSASTSSLSSMTSPTGQGRATVVPSVPYSGDQHIAEAFDSAISGASASTLFSPLSPAPPLPPLRSWHLRPVAEWHRHTSPVTSLHVTSDCTSVYSGDSHGAILHWSLPLHEEAKVNTSGLMGIGVPPADSPCLCSAQEKGKGVSRAIVRRYCVCHPKTCQQVVCDQCVLDHIRARHSPSQHRAAVVQAKQRAAKEQQKKRQGEEEAKSFTPATAAAPATSSDPSTSPSSSSSSCSSTPSTSST